MKQSFNIYCNTPPNTQLDIFHKSGGADPLKINTRSMQAITNKKKHLYLGVNHEIIHNPSKFRPSLHMFVYNKHAHFAKFRSFCFGRDPFSSWLPDDLVATHGKTMAGSFSKASAFRLRRRSLKGRTNSGEEEGRGGEGEKSLQRCRYLGEIDDIQLINFRTMQ